MAPVYCRGSDRQTGRTLIQYQETDWEFLKRMASQLGLPLVPDLSSDMRFDGHYYAVRGRCPVDRGNFICYDVVTGTRVSLGWVTG